jgi:hypothetical protein
MAAGRHGGLGARGIGYVWCVRWWVVLALVLAATACDGSGPVDGPGSPLAPGRPGSLSQIHPHQVATTGVSGDAATVDLVSGATTVTVRAADLGGADRLRALTPDGAGVAPVLDTDGDTVRVHLVRTGEPGSAEVTVLLDRRVRWQVRMSGGATSELLDLRSARLSGVDLAAGAARIELVLPVPDRAVPITMAGGATEFTLHVPRGVAAAVRIGGGAASTDVDGVRRTGLAAGTVLATAAATNRYDVDATAGVSTLMLMRL